MAILVHEAVECALKLARYHTGERTSLPFSEHSMDAPWELYR